MLAVDPTETISRFIFSSSHISRENNRVKHNAFMPYMGETSVFRVALLSEPEIWAIGDGISRQRTQQLHGRGDLLVLDAVSLALHVEPCEPPPRHANISGWPDGKELQKEMALQLAAKATLRVRI